jgi:hypothetical protein
LGSFFQNRDFIYFLRFLKAKSIARRKNSEADRTKLSFTPEDFIHSLRRNFGGVEIAEFKKMAQIMLKSFSHLTEDDINTYLGNHIIS